MNNQRLKLKLQVLTSNFPNKNGPKTLYNPYPISKKTLDHYSALQVPGTRRDYPTQRNNFQVTTDEQTFIISNQYTRLVSKASELLGVTLMQKRLK